MPSLLQKLSFFDPEVGRYFIVADDGFYWKQAKKSPEDSKVTRLLTQYGWELRNGNDVWLIFKRPRQPGELFVIRGDKKWYLDTPSSTYLSEGPQGIGLESLQKALDSGVLGGRAKAMNAGAAATAVNNAAKGVPGSVEGDDPFPGKTAAPKPTCPHCGSSDYGLMPSDFETAKCNGCGKNWNHGIVPGINDPKEAAVKYEDVFTPWPDIWDSLSGHDKATALRSNAAQAAGIGLTFWQAWEYADTSFAQLPSDLQGKLTNMAPHKGVRVLPRKKGTRQPMHDDSGASTGLRSRPDYGESDSYISEMNDENSKGASIIALDGGVKMGSAVAKAVLYVTGAAYRGLALEKFTFGPDRAKAQVFSKLTAQDLSGQMRGKFGVTAHVILAANYEDMFKAVLALRPQYGKLVEKEVGWAKSSLKKQDRIVWYLRWVRLAIMREIAEKAAQFAEIEKAQNLPAGTVIEAAAAAPAQVQRTEPATQEPGGVDPAQPTFAERSKALYDQYAKEMRSKGGNPEQANRLTELSIVKQNLDHYYGLQVPDIDNYSPKAESTTELYNRFSSIEQAWKEQEKRAIKPLKDDKVWMQFPDGWAWWFLPRSSCDLEAKAMGHCGNSPNAGKEGIGIISLRKPVKRGKETLWEPHLTFILHEEPVGSASGTLGEMKGKGNAKPTSQYHPYIMALLKDPRILGLGGGGYLASHNFDFSDLTPEQQAEVTEANPTIGLSLQDYYAENGMDATLVGRIKAILGLDEAKYDPKFGFVVQSWPDEDTFIEKTGSREAKKALAFVNTGEHNYDNPDIDELIELVDSLDKDQLSNLGQTIAYDHPKEIGEWYASFDPSNLGAVKLALTDLFNAYILKAEKGFNQAQSKLRSDISEAESDENADNEDYGSEAKKKTLAEMDKGAQVWGKVPVLKHLWQAYMSGGPNQDSVRHDLHELVRDEAITQRVEIRKASDGQYLQIIDNDVAVEEAQKHQQQKGNGGYYELPDYSWNFPYDWDDWDADNAKESLRSFFDAPPKKPEADKRQRRLFPEPKTEESAKRQGITVSHLKSPLFTRKPQITKA